MVIKSKLQGVELLMVPAFYAPKRSSFCLFLSYRNSGD